MFEILMESSTDLLTKYRLLSLSVSRDYSFVQGGGGNVSVKTDDLIYIKASGTRLNQTSLSSGFVILDRLGAYAAVTTGQSLTSALKEFSPAGRPSIEAPLHTVCPGLFTAHVHSVGAIALGLTDLAESVCHQHKWEFVDYACPGQPLLDALLRCKGFHSQHGTALLGNHGLLTWASSVEDCIRQVMRAEQICREYLLTRHALRCSFGRSLSVSSAEESTIDFSKCLDRAWLEFSLNTILIPDQAVLLEGVDLTSCISGHLQVDISDLQHDRQDIVRLLQLLGQLLTVSDCVRVLSRPQVDEVLGMDSERYRQGKIG